MMTPMRWIQLGNGVETWRIPTIVNHGDSTARENILVLGSDGLFDSGENDSTAVEKSFSSGSILPPKPRFSGLSFSLDFAIYSAGRENVDVAEIHRSFNKFLCSGTLTMVSDYPHNFTVQTQRVQSEKQEWKKGIMTLKVFFKAEEPF